MDDLSIFEEVEQFHVTSEMSSTGPIFIYHLPGGLQYAITISKHEWDQSRIGTKLQLDHHTRMIWDRFVPPGTSVSKAEGLPDAMLTDTFSAMKFSIAIAGHLARYWGAPVQPDNILPFVTRLLDNRASKVIFDVTEKTHIVVAHGHAYRIPSRTDAALFACGLYDREKEKVNPRQVLHELYQFMHPLAFQSGQGDALKTLRKYIRTYDDQPPREGDPNYDPEPFHGWFGLSYASYLVVPRRVLQSMPPEWQAKMVALLDELDSSIDWMPEDTIYDVKLCVDKEYEEGEDMIQVHDPNREYRHAPKLPIKGKKI